MAERDRPFCIEGEGGTIILVHGFTGGPASVAPLGESLATRTGLRIVAPLLPGHGQTPVELGETGFRDWIGAVEQCLEDSAPAREPVAMVGLSMGGTIALNIAARHPGRLAFLATINAPVGQAWTERAKRLLTSETDEVFPAIGSDIKKAGVREQAYDHIPARALEQLHLLIALTAAVLKNVTTPLTVFQSREDHVVDPANGPAIHSGVGTPRPRLVWLDNSWHVATLDNDLELIVHDIATFAVGAVEPSP
jgi:carboxylesterase